jgi:hypothetical protein
MMFPNYIEISYQVKLNVINNLKHYIEKIWETNFKFQLWAPTTQVM